MKLIKNTFLSIILLINLLYSTIVYVTESGNGTMNGTSWENALPGDSLQTAISNSQLGDEVWVAKGTYKPNSWPNVGSGDRQKHFAISNGLYGGFNGTETGISQRNIKNNETILSGDIGIKGDNSDNCYSVVVNYLNELDPEIDIIDGFTIEDGNAIGDGAGMVNWDCAPTIRNCTFRNNYALWCGGAVANTYHNKVTEMIIENCLFYDNSSGYGGAIFSEGISVFITNCVIVNNTAGYGGAIYTGGESNIITNCTIVNNTATEEGGGIYLTPRKYENFGFDFGINEISNNIIWSNNGVAQISRYDAYYVKFSFNAIQDGYEGFGNYSLSSNNEGDFNSPYFTDPDNNDWSLQSLSPCIDTGVFWNALDVDINLNPRPQGVSYDMGAYEYESLEPNAVLPTLSTLPAENISSTYATLRGNITDDGGTQLVAKGIKYSNISGFDPNTEGTLIRLMELLNEGEFELLVTNLSPDTTYYYRAYCENKIGYSYANEELSFTTTDSIIINPDINGIVYLKEDGIGDGSSWANALSGYKLQNGIDHVNTKEIWVAKGKYIPMNWPCERIEYKLDENDFIYKFQEYGKSERKYYGTTEREKHFTLRPSKKLYGGFAGTETSIDQRDIKNNETILSGDIGVKGYAQDNTYHVVYIGNELASDSNSVIDGFTIQDGYADGTIRDYSYFGGGMFNRCTPPTIQDCVFKNNYAIRGGGMFNVFGGLCGDISASPLIYNTIITQNVAELSGGGIFGFSASPTLINCLITQNTAGEEGGGICHKVYSFYDRVVAILKMQSCTIADNNAPIGNGLYIYHDLEDIEDKEIIQNSVIFGNIPALTFNFEDQVGPIQTISYCGITGGYFGEGNINLSPNNTGDEYSPYFSDPDNGHWWIQEHSPLRNAGIWTDDVPLYDIAGNLRDAVPDIGCYEYDPTGIEDNESSLPLTIKLYQNYPNPFNPVTNIKFDLSKTGKVELSVYNIAGQLVKKIVDKEISAGYHSVRFEANDLNSGMYFYTLRTSDKKLTRKMLMIK